MGTNYYVKQKLTKKDKDLLHKLISEDKIEEIEQFLPERVHIGKSSAGWRFLFNHNNWEYYSDMEELKSFIKDNIFYDEYGDKVDPDEFWKNVRIKEDNPDMLDAKSYEKRWEEFHPNTAKPDYMIRGDVHENEMFGYRFSTSTEFS